MRLVITVPGPSQEIPLAALLILAQAIVIRIVTNYFDPLTAAACLLGLPLALWTAPGILSQGVRRIEALRRDLRWWHVLWALIFLSDLVFRIRDTNSIKGAPIDFWAAYRIALVGTAGFLLLARFVAGERQWVHSAFQGLIKPLSLYACVCVISTMWSVYAGWTLYKSVEYFIDVAVLATVVLYAADSRAYKRLFDLTWVFFAALLASVWIGAAIWPQGAIVRGVGSLGFQIEGVLPSIAANGVGELSAVISIVASSRLLVRGESGQKSFYACVLAGGIATLIVSQTRSALFAFLFATALVLFLSRRVGIVILVAFIIGFVLCQTAFSDTFLTYFRRGQDQELFSTLSGRTGWWSFAWGKFMEKPLTGYGAYAGGRFAALAEMNQDATSSLHNTYFEVILGTSIWGLVPVVAAVAGVWWCILKASRVPSLPVINRQLTLEAAGVLSVVTVRSMFTSHLIWHPSLAFLVVLGYAEFLRRGKAVPDFKTVRIIQPLSQAVTGQAIKSVSVQ